MIYQQKLFKPEGSRCSKSSSKRRVYIIPLQKQEKSQINNVYLHLKQLEKEEWTKANVSRKRKNNKDQSRNKWCGNKENYGKDQWKLKLVLWEDKQN